MCAIWKGSINFGLIGIPVALQAVNRTEDLKFHLLRNKDLSPVNYKRVAALDGKEVPWDQIVKGYEYEKGKFVVLKEDDFKRVDLEATDTIDIIDLVDLSRINPIFFSRPYYLQPQKGGVEPYNILRQVLADTNKAGIAKVIIRTRQLLAAVKANGNLLGLHIMRFADEIIGPSTIELAAGKAPGKREQTMAKTLMNQLTEDRDTERYTDDYRSALMKVIDSKVKIGGKALPASKRGPQKAPNIIDLAAVLQQSLKEAGKSPPKAKAKPAKKKVRTKAA